MPRDPQTNYISTSGMIAAEDFFSSALSFTYYPIDYRHAEIQTKGIDYYVSDPVKQDAYTVELKTEVKHTGNLFAEYQYSIKRTGETRKSWLATCEADFVVYNFPFTPQTPTYFFQFQQFKAWCRDNYWSLRRVQQTLRRSEPTVAVGLLTPLEALQQETWFQTYHNVSGRWVRL